MAIIGEWVRRLGYLLRRRAREDELRREMEAHRAQMGEPPAFGNTLRLREEARDAGGWRWLDDLVADTRFAWRTLRHSPGFALTAIVTLALGIGVNIGMFSFVNGLLLRPLYANADQVVGLDIDATTADGDSREFSYPNYRDIQEGTTDVFASLAAFSIDFVGLDAGDGARSAFAAAVTGNYFQVFSAPPALGRSFTAEEDRPGADIRVAIISFQLWEQLGAGPDVLGRLVRINGEPFTVVGVAPQRFAGPNIPGQEVWLPLGAYGIFIPQGDAKNPFGSREAHHLGVVGRLRPGISAERAEAAVATVGRRLEQAFPAVNAGYALDLSDPSGSRVPFMPGMGPGALTGIALLLMLMPLTVLLVACLNLADLLLARGHVRRQELAVRSSLGGGRPRLVRQLLTEGLLLAVAGAAIGLWVSTWATKTLVASLRPLLPAAVSLPDVSVDWRVLVGTVAFSLGATLVFGAWPALVLTRRAAAADLKRQTGDEGRPGGLRIGNALVIGQIALSLLLLACGGLFMMSAIRTAAADPGFRLDGGVIVEVDPGLAGYDEARGRQAHRALLDRLRTVPGVEAITIASGFAVDGFGDERHVVPAGIPWKDRRQGVNATFTVVGRDYARVLRLPMLGGRDFTDAEMLPGSPERIAIIDDELAERLWPGEDALGRLIQLFDDEESDPAPTVRVVGIIPALSTSRGNPPSPHVYVPLGQHYASGMAVQLRVADGQDGRAMAANIARVARDLDERLPIVSVATWEDHVDASLDSLVGRAGAGLFGAFAAIALLLAVLGVYGVKSYVVSRRTREFGIRIAIGAHPRALVWQVLREGGRVTAIGIALGLLLAVGAGRILQRMLYGVNMVEPVVLVIAPLILLGASLLASYIPARRATRVNPTVALRTE
jgi:predicted permease